MEPTNRAAITYYRTFQKALEKIAEIDPVAKSAAYKSQLSQLELNLKNIKKIEPGFDTSKLETEIEKYKGTISAQDKNKSLDKDLIALNKGFEYFDKVLRETKLNFDNIDLQVKSATEPMQRDIAIFKKNHPDYNTAEFEKKIDEFQQKLRAKLQGAASENKETNTLRSDLEHAVQLKHLSWRDVEDEDFIYGSHNPTSNLYLPDYIWSQAGIDKLVGIVEEYSKRSAKFLAKYPKTEFQGLYSIQDNGTATSNDKNSRSDFKTNSILSIINNALKSPSEELKEVRTQLKALEEVADFVVETYFNKRVDALRWINLSDIFDNVPALVEIGKKNQELYDALGDLNQYKERIRQNSIKNAKKVRMPKAAKQDEEIEQLAKIAFEHKGWNEEVLKVLLLGTDWRLERNSEFIIGRVYDVAIAAKQKTGTCMLYVATIRQEDIGGKFSSPILSSYSSKAIAEENI